MSTGPRLLIVEDERSVAHGLQQKLEGLGYDVQAIAASGVEAFAQAQRIAPDLVLMDIRIAGDIDGIETALRMNLHRRVPVIYITAHSEESTLERARQTRPCDYLLKPFSELEMQATIKMALAQGQAEAELEANVAQLRESERRFRQLAESISEVFFLLEKGNSKVLYVSPAYEQVWGRSRESLYADPLSWLEGVHPDDRKRLREGHVQRLWAGHFSEEYRVLRPDGSQRWVSSRGFPILTESGEAYRVAGISEDVTARVALEEELRQRESALSRAQQVARLSHLVTRADGSFESWSDSLPGLLGLEPGAMPASLREWLELVHPEDRDLFRGRTIAAGATRMRIDQEYRLRTALGKWIDVRQVMEPMDDPPDARGRTRWFSTIQDVSEAKAVERELRESKRRFESMHHNAELISLMLDRQGNIVYCNEYLLRLTGWRSDEVLGKNWIENFLKPEPGMREAFEKLLQDHPKAWHHENAILTRSGEERLVHWDNSVLRAVSGEVIGTASLGVDISERKRAEEEVRRLNVDLERRVAERTAELEAANRELEAYDRSVSHDLRAPARHIQGFGTLLLESSAGKLDEAGREYLQRMIAASERMNQLVADLFALSTMGRGELHRGEVDLSTMAHQVFNSLLRTAAGRSVERMIAPDLIVRADGGLLKAILETLLGNAFKFTSRVEDAVVEVGSLSLGNGEQAYFVRDNGAGFDMQSAQRLFQPFQRLHSQAEFEGTGLGLATAQRIVTRHGGRIWAESQPGRGATFYFTLTPAMKQVGPDPIKAELQ